MRVHLLIILLITTLKVFAQSIQVGAGFNLNQVFLNTNSEIKYSFSDLVSTNYTLNNKNQSNVLIGFSPSVHTQYFFNDNIFVDYEVDFLSLNKIYNLEISTSKRNETSSNVVMNYSFLGQKVQLGYRFFKTKTIRVLLKGGLKVSTLTNLKELPLKSEEFLLKNSEPYGQVILQEINSFKKNIFSSTASVELQFYNFSLVSNYSKTLFNINKEESRDFYKSFSTLNVGLRIRLFEKFTRNVLKNEKHNI